MSTRGLSRLLVAALAALAVLPALAAAATPATLRLVANSPSLGRNVQVHAPAGDVSANPGRYQLRVTPQGGTVAERLGFCVDTAHVIHLNRDDPVVLETAEDAPELAGPAYGEIAWLLEHADALLAAAPAAGPEAAALQVAVWQLAGQAAEGAAPTSDATLNARAAALRAQAAGRRGALGLTLSADRPAPCLNTQAVLTAAGTPGAVVHLEVTGGTATLSASEVTLDAQGEGAVTLTSAVPGPVAVAATADGVALVRARKAPGAAEPQDTVFLVPRALRAEVTVTFTECDLYVLSPGVPDPEPVAAPDPAAEPGAPAPAAEPAPPPPPAPAAGPAPARAAPAPVRLVVSSRTLRGTDGVIVVRVRNDGTRPASGVRVMAGGRPVVVGTLAPGAVRVLRVRVAAATPRRTRVVASARNAAPVASVAVRAG